MIVHQIINSLIHRTVAIHNKLLISNWINQSYLMKLYVIHQNLVTSLLS